MRRQTLLQSKLLRQVTSSRTSRLELLEPRQLLAADVYISEFVASNDSFLDEDGDDPDWVEIYNAGPDSVNLSDWFLTDDQDELTKWQFPSHDLQAGEATVVFASGKDRAEAGEQMHTNFRLSAGGEYFALTRRTDAASVEIVSEFAPEYPQQVTDVSYGYPQSVETTRFVTGDSAAKVLVPTEEVDATWYEPTFDDSSWLDGQAAVGYQQTVPGFTVQEVRDIAFGFENLSEATQLLNGEGRYSDDETRIVVDPEVVPTINFQDEDGGGSRGRFRNDNLEFPGNNLLESCFTPEEIAEFVEQGFDPAQLKDDNFFVVRANGTINIPESGIWTFHTFSDDGVQVWIDGESVIREDTLTFDSPTDAVGTVELEAGPHTIELIYFEYVLGATLELSATMGEFTGFSARADFELIGDVESGGLEVRTSPSGGDVRLAGLVQTDLSSQMANQASTAYVRIPFDVEDPESLESLALKMR